MPKFFSTILFVLVLCIIPSPIYSQFGAIVGETILADITRRIDGGEKSDIIHRLSYSEKQAQISTLLSGLSGDSGGGNTYVNAPSEKKIVSANFKTDNPNIIFILFSDGTVSVLNYTHSQFGGSWEVGPRIPLFALIGFPIFNKIIGDAVYALVSGRVYASWDTAKTWSLDSINIGGETVNDIAVDISHYGWVVTQSRNLYYQHPDSNIWHKNTSFTTTGFPRAIFVDRKGRMFIATTASIATGRVMMSTDGGLSFTNISTGLTEQIISFGDDALGNVYAVGTGVQAFRLSNLAPPWELISDSLNAQKYLPSSDKIINSISGDSILYAATHYGLFQSTNYGTSWVHAPASLQSRSHNIHTPPIQAGNNYFFSNNLGIYRNAIGDSVWNKVFPQQGFVSGINAVTSDSAGNLYGNLPIKTSPSTWLFYIMKSTDYGNTWVPDTAGHKALGLLTGTQMLDYTVDRQGTQYLDAAGILYSKKPGQEWKRDTLGLRIKTTENIADVSLNNKKGIVYAGRRTGEFPTYGFALYKRAVNDSVWQVVDTSPITTTEARLYSDADGNLIVRTIGGTYKIWKYDGSTWTEIPLPTGIGSVPWPQHLAISKNGVLWGAFFGSNLNKGVYFTTNGGTSWKYVGLAGVGIKYVNTIEDTAYVVTILDGVHAFTTASEPTSVVNHKPEIVTSYELYQNYPNPFNPTTTIQFTIPRQGKVLLTIHDLLGREIAMIMNEERETGTHSVRFDARSLSTGVYFYTIRADAYVATKKLMVIK
jgi:photosystem II stability/assembly factor-like uncharacterized protein